MVLLCEEKLSQQRDIFPTFSNWHDPSTIAPAHLAQGLLFFQTRLAGSDETVTEQNDEIVRLLVKWRIYCMLPSASEVHALIVVCQTAIIDRSIGECLMGLVVVYI